MEVQDELPEAPHHHFVVILINALRRGIQADTVVVKGFDASGEVANAFDFAVWVFIDLKQTNKNKEKKYY